MPIRVFINDNKATPEMKATKKAVKRELFNFAAEHLNLTFGKDEPNDKYNLWLHRDETGALLTPYFAFYLAGYEAFTDTELANLLAHLEAKFADMPVSFAIDEKNSLRIYFNDFKSHTLRKGWVFPETEDKQEAPVIAEAVKPVAPAALPRIAPPAPLRASVAVPAENLPPLPVSQVTRPVVRKTSRNPFDF